MAKVRIVKELVRLTNYRIGDIIEISESLAVEFLNTGAVELVENRAETAAVTTAEGKVEKKKGK